MKEYLLDTNIISAIFKGNKGVIEKTSTYLQQSGKIYIPAIVYYELQRGLLALKGKKKYQAFSDFINQCELVLLTKETLDIAAEIYAGLAKKGNLIEDADILIAATALEKKLILVTNNQKHFSRIKSLKFEDWIA